MHAALATPAVRRRGVHNTYRERQGGELAGDIAHDLLIDNDSHMGIRRKEEKEERKENGSEKDSELDH